METKQENQKIAKTRCEVCNNLYSKCTCELLTNAVTDKAGIVMNGSEK